MCMLICIYNWVSIHVYVDLCWFMCMLIYADSCVCWFMLIHVYVDLCWFICMLIYADSCVCWFMLIHVYVDLCWFMCMLIYADSCVCWFMLIHVYVDLCWFMCMLIYADPLMYFTQVWMGTLDRGETRVKEVLVVWTDHRVYPDPMAHPVHPAEMAHRVAPDQLVDLGREAGPVCQAVIQDSTSPSKHTFSHTRMVFMIFYFLQWLLVTRLEV